MEEAIYRAERRTEDRVLRLAAKHMMRLWWKPAANPENALSGMLLELYPDMSSGDRHVLIRSLIPYEDYNE